MSANDKTEPHRIPIKPCPFCHASKAEVSHGQEEGEYDHVFCPGCGAQGPDSATETTAIILWNLADE